MGSVACLLLVSICSPVWGQFGGLSNQILDPVSWEETFSRDGAVEKGEELILSFAATIEPGYWVYSAVPSEGNPGAATSFHWDDTAVGVESAGELKEEGKAKKYYDEIFETDMVKYLDKVTFKQSVRVSEADAQAEGFIRYQVCNDETCIPKEYSFAFAPNVVEKKKSEGENEEGSVVGSSESGEEGKESTADGPRSTEEGESQEERGERREEKESAANGPQSTEVTETFIEPVETQRSSSLWRLMLQGFLFGLASVLTPCIFPMIPLTVSYFTKRGKNRGKGIRDAVFYGLSIIAIYTVLAMVQIGRAHV